MPADEAPLLYYSMPGHLPFSTEEEAMNYVLSNHLELFFNIKEIDLEAPKGNFRMVNKWGYWGVTRTSELSSLSRIRTISFY